MFYFDWTYAPWSDMENPTVICEENVQKIQDEYLENSGQLVGHYGVFTLTVCRTLVLKNGSTKWKVLISCDVSETNVSGTLLQTRGSLNDVIKAAEKLIMSKPLPKALLW